MTEEMISDICSLRGLGFWTSIGVAEVQHSNECVVFEVMIKPTYEVKYYTVIFVLLHIEAGGKSGNTDCMKFIEKYPEEFI